MISSPAGCKSGLGYVENSCDNSYVKLNLKDKFTKINFVKEGSFELLADHKGDNNKGITTNGNEIPKVDFVRPPDRKSS